MSAVCDETVEAAAQAYIAAADEWEAIAGRDSGAQTLAQHVGARVAARVHAKAVAGIIEAIGEVLPEALGHNSLPDIVRGIGRQRDWQHGMKDHLADVARRLTDERDGAVAEAVAEERQRIAAVLENINRSAAAGPGWSVAEVLENIRQLRDTLAAGSVPVATPAESDARAGSKCWCGRDKGHAPLPIAPIQPVAEPSVGYRAPAEEVSGGSGHAERQEDRPVEIASLPIEELPDWADLAEAVGATLHNREVGCSGEYQTEMRWPDGRVATYRDRLAIISADSELPPVEWQIVFERMQADHRAEVARHQAAIEQIRRLRVDTTTGFDPDADLNNAFNRGLDEALNVLAAALGDGGGGTATHEFVGVRDHTDDDECTYRPDGTDATYCGLPASEHPAENPSRSRGR